MTYPLTLLAAQDVRVLRGEQVVLSAVSLQLQSGERLALLGRNGAGKTTLLNVLAGQLVPDEGQVWYAPGLRLATLAQHAYFAPGLSVAQWVEQANPYAAQLAQLRALEPELVGSAGAWQAYDRLQQQLDIQQAYTWPVRAAKTLDMLALSGLQTREAATLSGGERTRLRLALALLAESDVLLLDEPTNHLDIRMREWLEQYLLGAGRACLITSHDREFLDKVAQQSLWLEGGQAEGGHARLYPGGYTRAQALREAERRRAHKTARLSRRERGRLQGSADRLDVWGRQSRAVKSRARKVPLSEAPLPERRITMQLLAGQSQARLLVWGEHLSYTLAERTILHGVAFKVRQGDRIVLMGANGTGKTTLLNLLAGRIYPVPSPEGSPPSTLRFAAGVTVAYLDQIWHGLNPHQTLYTQFEERFGARAGALLGRAGFAAAHWPKLPAQLSGGEQARAGLALVSALRADLLLLDEPTNHLDVTALEALEDAVKAYGGAVITVTHDRRFAREVATRVWHIAGGQLQEVEGWGSRAVLDPARNLQGDPPPPPPESPKAALRQHEDRLLALEALLNADLPPTQREQSRALSERHQLRQELYGLYAEYYAVPQFDHEVRHGPLTIRAQRLETGGIFWAAHNDTCPHLAWDGVTLRWNTAPDLPPVWYGEALLAGALRILFERWHVTRVQLGESGPVLLRRQYLKMEFSLRVKPTAEG